MKKLLFVLMFCMVSLIVHAQEVEHLQFMGIPIDGNIKDFHSELTKKGFKRQSYSIDGTRKYNGVFSGENVELHVAFDKQTKTVYKVAVLFPCYRDQNLAERKYNNYKYSLESKYKVYTFSTYSSIYKDNGVQLEEDIKNSKLTSLNSSREWSSDENKETCIFVSRPTIYRYFEGDSLRFASVFAHSLGNVGTITVKTFKLENIPFTIYGVKYENGLLIIYEDHKNSLNIIEKNKDDL